MKKLLKLCALAAFCLPMAAKADNYSPFSNLFIFGDSLSDVGNGNGAPETTPPGSIWANFLAADLGLGPVVASKKGGNDFAISGSKSGVLNYPVDPTDPITAEQQTQNFLNASGGHVDQNALYTVWAGANDLRGGLVFAGTQTNPSFNQTQFGLDLVNDSTNNIVDITSKLHNAGARYVLVPNLPLLGNTPALFNTAYVQVEFFGQTVKTVAPMIQAGFAHFGITITPTQATEIAAFIAQTQQPTQAQIATFLTGMGLPSTVAPLLVLAEQQINATIAQDAAELAANGNNLSASYNNELLAKFNASGLNPIQVDIAGLLTAIQKNYQKFGFSGPFSSYEAFSVDQYGNVTTIINPGNPNQYVFFDGYHPSSETDLIGSEYFMSVLEGPEFAGILAQAPLSVMDAQNQQLQAELLGIQTGTTNSLMCKWRVFASGAYNMVRRDDVSFEQRGFNNDNQSFTVGADYRFNQNGIFGVAVGRSMGDVKFDNDAGGFDIDENMVNVFGGYQFLQNRTGNAYANASVGYGNVDYSDAHRNFMLGIVPETVSGETTGDHYAADANVGYNFSFINKTLNTGPLVTLDYQHVTVNPYSEVSNNFQTANGAFDTLQYGKQQLDSFVGGAGWQLSYAAQLNSTKVLPFVQATYNHQFMDTTNNVEAGVTTLPGSSFSLPVKYPDSDYGLVTAGVQGIFSNGLALTFGLRATVGQSDVNSQTYMLNASVPL